MSSEEPTFKYKYSPDCIIIHIMGFLLYLIQGTDRYEKIVQFQFHYMTRLDQTTYAIDADWGKAPVEHTDVLLNSDTVASSLCREHLRTLVSTSDGSTGLLFDSIPDPTLYLRCPLVGLTKKF